MEFKEYLLKKYDEDFVNDFLSASKDERTSSLILNTNKYSKDILNGVNLISHPYIKNAFYYDKNVNKLGIDYRFENGVYFIQDAASMMTVHALDVQKDDVILDLCAAPGGKTIDAAIKLNNSGLIVANDISYERCRVLSSNIERMGFSNVIISNTDFEKVYTHYLNSFDKIILDAPCSGSFMFRKNENARLDWTYEKVLSCQKTQRNLIEIAYQMLKPGGKLIYSTCSISPEENEEIISELLKNHDDIHAQKLDFNDDVYESKILKNSYYFLPFKFNCEGQFICLLTKDGIQKNYIPNSENFKKYSGFAGFFDISFENYITKNDQIYGYNSPIKLNKLNILKYGLLISKKKGKIEIPSFHLAHFLDSKKSIKLTEEEFKKYIHGEEISRDINSDGFHVVSYNEVNLGFVKSSNGKLKNHYPKGLRK